MSGPPLDQVSHHRPLLVGECLVELGVEFDAAAVPGLGQQDLGVKPGRLAAVVGQVAGGPVEYGLDSPALDWSVGWWLPTVGRLRGR